MLEVRVGQIPPGLPTGVGVVGEQTPLRYMGFYDGIWLVSGRYASYWNVFLVFNVLHSEAVGTLKHALIPTRVLETC